MHRLNSNVVGVCRSMLLRMASHEPIAILKLRNTAVQADHLVLFRRLFEGSRQCVAVLEEEELTTT